MRPNLTLLQNRSRSPKGYNYKAFLYVHAGRLGHVTRPIDASYKLWLELAMRFQRCLNPGGGGGTLKFSVYIGEADFFGVKILNFYIFGGFQKN